MRAEYKPYIRMLEPAKLRPYTKNAKRHPNEQIDKIAAQINAFGFDQPIVCDSQFVVIKGHGRLEAAIRLGLERVPVILRDDLNENEASASRIGDNKVAESDWINDNLKFEFGTLSRADFDLDLTGFDEGERRMVEADLELDISLAKDNNPKPTGLEGKITVTCPGAMRAELKGFLQTTIDGSGFEGVELN